LTAPGQGGRTMDHNAEKPRILIIEDDPDQRLLLVDMLAMHYGDSACENIVAVGDGASALAQDLAGFDVILQDFNLPDTNGLELVEKILARADVPVVFVTGENDAATAAEALRRGAQDYVVKHGDYLFAIPVIIGKSIRQHEIQRDNRRLHGRLEGMLEELRVKNEQLEESMEQLARMAATDHLTGVANRRQFAELLEAHFEDARKFGHDLTCCMCDLDHYKQFNDALGHQVGDRILEITADVIRKSVRARDLVARYGGDEFVILLPRTAVDQAAEIGHRIRKDLAGQACEYGEPGRQLSISIGIASLHADQPPTADHLVAMADRALMSGKSSGRNCVVLFHESPAETPVG
jgi:diguanylate cyclase (GGDEF)-like protein